MYRYPSKIRQDRFESAARKELGDAAYTALVTFNDQLRTVLHEAYPGLRDKDCSKRSTASKLFKTFVPLHRDLHVFLHQRGAQGSFQPALTRLVRTLFDDITMRVHWRTNSFESLPAVGQLPMPAWLLVHLAFERRHAVEPIRTAAARTPWSMTALRTLQGNTLDELAAYYVDASGRDHSKRRTLVRQLLAKVHGALGETDFAYLQENMTSEDLRQFKPAR